MGYDPSVANAWAQAYGTPAPLPQAQAMGSNVLAGYAAPATTNYGNLSGGIGQDVLQRMHGTQMWDPSGGNGSTGSWGWEGGQPIYGSDANGNPLPVTYSPKTLVYHPQGQGVGEQYPTFDPVTGEFKGYQTGSKVQSYASGVLSVLGAAAGMGAAFGGAGAGGYAAGGYAGGGGAAAGGAGTAGAAASGTGVAGLSDGASMDAAYGGLDGGATLGGGGSFGGAGMGSTYAGGTATAMGAGAGGGSGGGAGGAAGGGVTPPNPYYGSGAGAASGAGGSMFGGGSGSGFNWGSLVGPALSGAAGLYGSKQSNDAAKTLADAANNAAAQYKPWVDNGAWAMNQAGSMMGRNGPDAAKAAFTQDPGYQFRLDQGNQALTRAAAASGGLGSGKYLKDAMTYNQGQASQEFGNSYNRLMGLAGMGQTATGSAADYTTSGASALASGKVAGANSLTNALGQGWSMYNTGQQQNQSNAFQNALMQRWSAGG